MDPIFQDPAMSRDLVGMLIRDFPAVMVMLWIYRRLQVQLQALNAKIDRYAKTEAVQDLRILRLEHGAGVPRPVNDIPTPAA